MQTRTTTANPQTDEHNDACNASDVLAQALRRSLALCALRCPACKRAVTQQASCARPPSAVQLNARVTHAARSGRAHRWRVRWRRSKQRSQRPRQRSVRRAAHCALLLTLRDGAQHICLCVRAVRRDTPAVRAVRVRRGRGA
jgi:hypothetical protein